MSATDVVQVWDMMTSKVMHFYSKSGRVRVRAGCGWQVCELGLCPPLVGPVGLGHLMCEMRTMFALGDYFEALTAFRSPRGDADQQNVSESM